MGTPIRQFDPTERAWRSATRSLDRPLFATSGSWECDLSDNSLRWSPGVFALFGLDLDAPIDRRAVLELYESESRRLMEQLRARAIDERGSFTMEAQIRRADGALRWMRLTADVACRNGRATHLYGIKQDISAEMTR